MGFFIVTYNNLVSRAVVVVTDKISTLIREVVGSNPLTNEFFINEKLKYTILRLIKGSEMHKTLSSDWFINVAKLASEVLKLKIEFKNN